MFKRFKSVSMMLLLGGISAGATNVVPMASEANIVQQDGVCKGVIKDSAGETIIGASVVVKGTTNGTITGLDGEFAIEDVKVGDVIQVSFVGYVTQELKWTGSPMAFVLKEDTKTLDEVVVVGYGVQKKANLTGSVASVDAKALDTRPVSSVSAALAGQMPGVTAIQSSGAPGSQSSSITIRGKNSINAASPLVIVDGIPGSMNTIDPADIESLTVLKDAASAAIYGVQAANGVILITTKQGKKGEKTRVSYSGNVSWATPVVKRNYLGAYDFAVLYNEATKNENPNAPLTYSEQDLEDMKSGKWATTDWYGETFKKAAFEHQHNLSISGGSEKTTYNASLGYVNQGGLTKAIDYSRYNARMNLQSEINKYITVGVNASGYRGISNDDWMGFVTAMQGVSRAYPTEKIRDNEGNFVHNGSKDNPVAIQKDHQSGFRKTTDQELNLTAFATINLLKGLSLKGVYSVRNYTRNNEGFKKYFEYGGWNSGLREGYDDHYDHNYYTGQVLLNFNRTFGKHSINALAGLETYEHIYKYTKANRKGGGNNDLGESLNTLDASSQKNEDGGYETARVSYFGRVQYDYMNKYLFEVNVRSDASSRFPKGNRWGVFPAVSAGWRLSEEAFIKDNVSWISNLKVRVGWGKTGNEELAADDIYPSILAYSYGDYMFNNTLYSTVYESRFVNKNLKWATVTNYDFGLEAGFFNNKLNMELSVYKKVTNDMLLYLPIPGVIGVDAPAQNAGEVQNRGFELTLSHNNQINKDWSYNVSLNVGYVKNEITDMCNTDGPNKDNDKIWYKEGYPIGSYYGLVADGFYNTPEELASHPKRTGNDKVGDIKYKDLNHDNKIDDKDRTVIGKNFPSWTGGLNLSLSYKNFDLSALFQGAFDVDGYYTGEAAYAFYNGATALKKHMDRWTPEHHNASYPRVTLGTQTNYVTSSFWVKDASYVRLKNLTIGYNVPKDWLSKLGVASAKLFLSGENLFTITGLDDIDPEEGNERGWSYGNVKKFSLGLRVSF